VLEQENQIYINYPDVVSVRQLQEMLGGISRNLVYRLLRQHNFEYRKIGREYRIKKSSVVQFFYSETVL